MNNRQTGKSSIDAMNIVKNSIYGVIGKSAMTPKGPIVNWNKYENPHVMKHIDNNKCFIVMVGYSDRTYSVLSNIGFIKIFFDGQKNTINFASEESFGDTDLNKDQYKQMRKDAVEAYNYFNNKSYYYMEKLSKSHSTSKKFKL